MDGKKVKSNLSEKMLLYWYKKHESFAAQHGWAWKFRPTASYFGRTKTFVLSRCKSDLIRLDNYSMYIPENEYLHVVVLEDDGLDNKVVRKIVKKGDTVLDLGANIGYWTCLLADLVGKDGRVFAFEPSPYNFGLLKKNVELNGYKNVTLEQKAVAGENYKTLLYLSKGTMDNRIYNPLHENRQTVEVDVVKLDDYFKNMDVKFDFIKSNVQGADFAALKGMSGVLEKSENVKIEVEFSPMMEKEFKANTEEFIDRFVSMGFSFFEQWWFNKKLVPVDPEKLKRYAKENHDTNLLCVKKNMLHTIEDFI